MRYSLIAVALVVLLSAGCTWESATDDPAVVFRKAFSTSQPKGVEVLDARFYELRHGLFVEEWQWFIAFRPTAHFQKWLLSDDAFRLKRLPKNASLDGSAWLHKAPDWFAPKDRSEYEIWQRKEGDMTLYIDKRSRVFYMTDYAIQ